MCFPMISVPDWLHATCWKSHQTFNKYDVLYGLVPFTKFKNVKNSHGGVLLLVKLQTKACFSRFLNYTNGTKSYRVSQIRSKHQRYLKKKTDIYLPGLATTWKHLFVKAKVKHIMQIMITWQLALIINWTLWNGDQTT